MRKYYREVFLYINKTVFDKTLAEDITQETFTRLINNAKSKIIHNERALLYRIAKNIMVDMYREKSKVEKISFNEDEYYEETDITQEQVLEDEKQKVLMEEIDKLPKKRRQAFTLHMIDGYSREEVAKIMNISFNAVEQHISRASNQLKERLINNEGNGFE